MLRFLLQKMVGGGVKGGRRGAVGHTKTANYTDSQFTHMDENISSDCVLSTFYTTGEHIKHSDKKTRKDRGTEGQA